MLLSAFVLFFEHLLSCVHNLHERFAFHPRLWQKKCFSYTHNCVCIGSVSAVIQCNENYTPLVQTWLTQTETLHPHFRIDVYDIFPVGGSRSCGVTGGLNGTLCRRRRQDCGTGRCVFVCNLSDRGVFEICQHKRGERFGGGGEILGGLLRC